MNRCYTARMAGVPALQERQCGPVAYLADDNPVGAQTHGALEQAGHVNGVARMKEKRVLGSALNLGCVLKDHNPITWSGLDNLGDNSVGECCLARPGSPGDNDV